MENNERKVVPAHDYQANALEENMINDAGEHQFKEVNHSYRKGTINFSIVKQDTRIIGFDKLDVKHQMSLYVFIRADKTRTYISQNKEALQAIIMHGYS